MSRLTSAASLCEVAAESLERFGNRPALWVGRRTLTYAELQQRASAIAATLLDGPSSSGRVAVLADRNETAYSGILGALLAGYAYVPLNPRFSAPRILDILQQSEADAVVCDARGEMLLRSFGDALPSTLSIVGPEAVSAAGAPGGPVRRATARACGDDLAYIMFTSGTTGRPKGVPVSHGNVLALLENLRTHVPARAGDRFLQLLDVSFDPSVHDLFSCWSSGACLYSVPEGMATMADRFVREFQITHFCAAASTAAVLQAQGRLTPAAMPSLRETIFGGEALPASLAVAWRKAAPGSSVRNHYGPTEATVAITECVWQDGWEEEITGTVPIGQVFEGQRVLLVDEALQPVAEGTPGELLVSGTQVTRGYLNNPLVTAEKYVSVPGFQGTWYRTGDLVERDPRFGLRYRGRIDQQLKVRGFRVEAQEVENHVRAASGSDLVAVIGWPRDEDGLVTGLVAFVVQPARSPEAIVEACRTRMPDYMVPARVVVVDELPFTANGKVDYAALARSA